MTTTPPDPSVAAEFVLGLLEGDALAAAERRVETDAAFAQQVEAWRAKLIELDDAAEALSPSVELWSRIERDVATAAPTVPASASWLAQAWNSLTVLRVGAVGGAITAVACAVLAVSAFQHARETAARKPIYVALLVDDASRRTGAIVNAFADGRVEMIPLVDMPVPADRALQVWTLWNRETGPRSVGLMSKAHALELNLKSLPTTAPDQLFEITVEPANGSPTGRPTGPILYKGTTTRAL